MQNTLKRRNSDVGRGTESINEGTNTLEEFKNDHHVQHKHERAHKRLKPLVLDEALEQKLKDLYEEYKDFLDCSHRIVAELNLEVSPAQVSKKLKDMGFKLPSKRRMVDTNDSNNHREATETSLKQPSFARKRVHAFSEDQEMKIKTLFEQFKGKKKCSQLIASALDGDDTFTAAQVARKLRQLGLRLCKQKSGDNMHLRDEDVADSDGETLLALKERNKKKQNIIPTEETQDHNQDQLSDRGDDIVLSSAFRSKRKQYKVDHNRDQLPDASDYIVPSSAFRKGSTRLSQTRCQESQDDSIEVKKYGCEDVRMTERPDHMLDHGLGDDLADEVIDFANNASPVTSQKARRKLRMVIDQDDED